MQRIAPIMSLVLFVVSACVLASCTATYTPPPSMPGTSAADQQLANAVSGRLSEDSLAGRFTFGVTAKSGVVTIQGSVPDEIMRQRIVGIVRGTPGVQSVVDRLYRM